MTDSFANLVDLWLKSSDQFAARPAFGTKTASGWQWITYGELRAQVDAFRAGLSQLGIGLGDRVGLISNNRVEWAVAAYASLGLGAAIVPMYEAQPASEWAFILRDSGSKAVLCATASIFDQLSAARGEVPSLEHVLGMALPESDPRSYAHVLASGQGRQTPALSPAPQDVAGFLYTAGTTGEPKGVVLSHDNMVSNVNAVRALFPISCEDTSLAFLPWAHAFGQTCELHMLTSYGCAIAINDEVPSLVGNLAEVKPSILISVPRIFNRIYDGVNKQMQDKPAPIRALFRRAIAAATQRSRGQSLGLWDNLALALADKLIFNKIRGRMGGRLRYAVSGSAALSKEVGEFVDALGIQVYEGYGLTETSPVATVNYPGHRKMGSVGKAIPGVRIEIDTQATGDAENGEIVVHGPCVMQGYHNRSKETGEVLRPDRGLRTGDMGRLDAEGYLFITGRIKEQYKLENGKYVVPSLLEEALKLSPYIANIMLYGHNKPHNVALVVADVDSLKKWAGSQGKTLGDLASDSAVQELIAAELARSGAAFKSFERPTKFAVISEDFTVENGMLTPKLSLKRRKVLEKYGALLDSLYVKK
jgi:long-chain acyl-CoA synthetase